MNVIGPLVQFQQQLRIFHWQTDSFAEHKAFGKAYEDLDGLVDDFVETYMGRFGKIKPTITFNLILRSLESQNSVKESLEKFEEYLISMSEEISNETYLLNIRDEMLALINKLRYLLTLR
jgi:hypothetical protein